MQTVSYYFHPEKTLQFLEWACIPYTAIPNGFKTYYEWRDRVFVIVAYGKQNQPPQPLKPSQFFGNVYLANMHVEEIVEPAQTVSIETHELDHIHNELYNAFDFLTRYRNKVNYIRV